MSSAKLRISIARVTHTLRVDQSSFKKKAPYKGAFELTDDGSILSQ
jgi:hypothetical protein